MLYISDTSRYTNIVYIGMHLVYLVLTYKERLISLFASFLAISELLAISNLRAFSFVIYGKFNSRYPLSFLAFFTWLVNCASLVCKLSGTVVYRNINFNC